MVKKKDETISLRGDKHIWVRFVNKVREEKVTKDKSLTVWAVLKGLIESYLSDKK